MIKICNQNHFEMIKKNIPLCILVIGYRMRLFHGVDTL